MKKKLNNLSKVFLPITILLLASTFYFSCEKEVLPPPVIEVEIEEVIPSLTLEVTLNPSNGNYECNWKQLNTPSFAEYVLVYSTNPIPLEYNARVGFNNVNTATRIQDINQTGFSINPYRRNQTVYVQVIIDQGGDKFLRSNQVELSEDSWQSIGIIPSKVVHHPEKNAFYIFEYGSNRLVYYDYLEKRIMKEVNLNVDFAFTELKFGDNGLGEELYLIHDDINLTILDANTLEVKLSYQFPYTVHSITSNDKGILVVAARINNGPIQILNRSDMSVLNTLNFSDHTVIRGVAFLSKDENKFVETGRHHHHLYEIDDDGELLSHNTAENPYKKSGTNNNITVSPSGNYFVNTKFGEIYDADLNPIRCLVNSNEYINYFFDEDQNYFYSLRKNTQWIYKYDLPSISYQDYHGEGADLHPISLFKIDGELMMFFRDKSSNDVLIKPFYFQP